MRGGESARRAATAKVGIVLAGKTNQFQCRRMNEIVSIVFLLMEHGFPRQEAVRASVIGLFIIRSRVFAQLFFAMDLFITCWCMIEEKI